MDSNKINALLEKYFEGTTSLEEEQTLKNYFQQDDIAPELKAYKGLFQYFTAEQDVLMSSDFDARLLEKLDPPVQQKGVRTMDFSWMRIAAAVLLLVAVFFTARQWPTEPAQTSVDWTQYESENPEDAYEATMAALALVSKKMQTGEKETLKGLGKIKQVNQEIHN
jgi:hypothetical protein